MKRLDLKACMWPLDQTSHLKKKKTKPQMKKPPEQINKQKNHENLTNLRFSDRLKKN